MTKGRGSNFAADAAARLLGEAPLAESREAHAGDPKDCSDFKAQRAAPASRPEQASFSRSLDAGFRAREEWLNLRAAATIRLYDRRVTKP